LTIYVDHVAKKVLGQVEARYAMWDAGSHIAYHISVEFWLHEYHGNREHIIRLFHDNY